MFGDDTTEFGRAMLSSISDYYKYSIDSNLASVISTMKNEIVKLQEPSFINPNKTPEAPRSQLINHTDLPMTKETVEDELTNFTTVTGIPIVVVVDTVENIYGKGLTGTDIAVIVMCLVFIGIAVFLIIKAIKNRRNGGGSDGSGSSGPYTYGGGDAYGGPRGGGYYSSGSLYRNIV